MTVQLSGLTDESTSGAMPKKPREISMARPVHALAVLFDLVANRLRLTFCDMASQSAIGVFEISVNTSEQALLGPLLATRVDSGSVGNRSHVINGYESSGRKYLDKLRKDYPVSLNHVTFSVRTEPEVMFNILVQPTNRKWRWLTTAIQALAETASTLINTRGLQPSSHARDVFQEYRARCLPPSPPKLAPVKPSSQPPARTLSQILAELQRLECVRNFNGGIANVDQPPREQVEERIKESLTREERPPGSNQKPKREPTAVAPSRNLARSLSPSQPPKATPLSTGVAPRPEQPIPEVPVHLDFSQLQFQDSLLPISSMKNWQLREMAAQWWVTNQSDDLLGLPYCNVERLEYQVRAALRVIGPLRGRALLSDEVGLGKTVEAGLILKEYLVRGMVRRFLVLTQPSLVDQWAEELASKFAIEVATTNQAAFRADPLGFWKDQTAVVASLHTLKQPSHLAVAEKAQWDLLIVDEAHHLRNRASQAWQAVNSLPRQFLLLLTATPVQNSLDELYNLVTLLQPGQLPSPKEFSKKFLDSKRPHQPKEPEELRRLLGQVMIRNTRANAGLNLPPRRAETALFEPDAEERAFWQNWETELRRCLKTLPASQSSLWGRLLLQAAGSSPAAWHAALEKFPDAHASRAWRQTTCVGNSWKKKCDLIPPLARSPGGVVVFTQFLATQAALEDALKTHRIPVIALNGATPAAQRQPLTERFRSQGGVLLLTQSGTEGRNLQFCHQLVNFDLPWNPMEIEQRIGRLHRLGQMHPVRISNFVQSGTLQEHLLNLLQEKLNLFELVVGEAGLILGERFAGEEFAEAVLNRWRESEGRVADAFAGLGEEIATARGTYDAVRQLDNTLFAQDYANL